MPNYAQIRQMVSHRVTFEYDTGAKIVGYLAACRPSTGPVQVVTLSRAEVLDATGEVVERRNELTLVPNALVGVRLTEGPRGRDM